VSLEGQAMDAFHYRDGVLCCEEVELDAIAARHGTPTYVYSSATFRRQLAFLAEAFAPLDPLVCYAVKTCGNIHLLRQLADGGAGADVVSGGELYRALTAGVPADKVVFAGVGKSETELGEAIEAGIRYVNVESESELETLGRLAADLGRTVPVAIRVNPDVAGHDTPRKTTTGTRGSKFGVDIGRVPALFERGAALTHVRLDGLHVHLGSPIASAAPYVRALGRILDLVEKLRVNGHEIVSVNMGGGFAADYATGSAPRLDDYAAGIVPLLEPFVAGGGQVIMEPGRSIAANAGVLLTRVRYIKDAGDRRVAIVDAGMNSFARVALYEAFHFLWPVRPRDALVPPSRSRWPTLVGLRSYDIAGPVCESTDYLARGRELPPLREGDLLCVFGAGAYGMAMASQYNSSPRPPEVLVEVDAVRTIRRRETYVDLISAELGL
jgi:diaminopimelate decarboxylase